MDTITVNFNGLRIDLFKMETGDLGMTIDHGDDDGAWVDIVVEKDTLVVSTDNTQIKDTD